VVELGEELLIGHLHLSNKLCYLWGVEVLPEVLISDLNGSQCEDILRTGERLHHVILLMQMFFLK
jgi:hypothetical protein